MDGELELRSGCQKEVGGFSTKKAGLKSVSVCLILEIVFN